MTDIILTLILVFVFLQWWENQPVAKVIKSNAPYEIAKFRARIMSKIKRV
jgi:hypothetical protein